MYIFITFLVETMTLARNIRLRINKNLVCMFTLLITLLWYESNQFLPSQKDPQKTKYVLIWSPVMPIFYNTEDEGLDTFIENSCEHSNCVLTADRRFFEDLRQFDAIIFSAYAFKLSSLPWVRSPQQKYIMASLESPQYFMGFGVDDPVYFFNNYFNWTWTYRLNSDILWRYFIIYDVDGKEVGPKVDVNWLKEFQSLSEEKINKLKSKSKAAAWIVSHCVTFARREYYVNKLRLALESYNLTLDRYGECAEQSCGDHAACARMVRKDYYFYLAFENSFDEDYVTEKVLKAVQGLAVPIVMGGANYTRFLPLGSYLDARKLSPREMARTMHDIITNSTLHQEFFRWTNHYKYKEAHRTETCNLCNALNNEEMVKNITIYPNMKKWWTGTYKDIDYIYNKVTLGPLFASLSINF